MTNLIGKTLLNQFRVDSFVASGGMGAVYRVWDTKRNVPLAMKVLHADYIDDPSAFKSFQREARALQRLRHPNVVPFYGLYQTEDFTFILQAFIDGPSLREILKKHPGGLPAPEAIIYLRALCAALGYAHSNGVVHCDIKPANIMTDQGGQIYLADFGISRHAESTTTTLAGAGTPAYMAPEQIRIEEVFPTTDIYALGVLLFEMLTGKRPFRGDEPALVSTGSTSGERIRHAHLHLQPPDPRQINSSISPDWLRSC
jgi:eukaryotic-like serine/threonine-protein kinase